MADRETSVAFAKPCLDEREAEAAGRAVMSGWVTQGPEVEAFEREFAAGVGSAHACAVSSCTAALHLALQVVGVKPGDEVVTVSHSYIATAGSIRHCGAKPVFVDIEPRTFNMDPARVERAVTERTRAILCVHQLGMPCDLGAILPIAARLGLPVVEDAACALGSEILWNGQWERIGKPHADVACFSFHPRKLVTTGDGGMITTANAEWDRRLRLLRHNGMDTPDRARHESGRVEFERYPEVGYNYRMTDIQAAVGRVQLTRLAQLVARRREIAGRYVELLGNIQGLGLPHEPKWCRTNWQSYAVRLPTGCAQRRVMQFMLDRGVATRRGVMCIHREECYAKMSDRPNSLRDARTNPSDAHKPTGKSVPHTDLRESETAQDATILLPMHHALSDDDLRRVADALRTACRESPAH